jgi:hypothetical protein
MQRDAIGELCDRLKDDAILVCAMSHGSFFNEQRREYHLPDTQYFQQSAERSLEETELQLLSAEPSINAPLLFLTTDAKEHNIPLVYIPADDGSFPLQTYISYWRRFFLVSSVTPEFGRAVFMDSLPHTKAQLGERSLLSLIDRFWRDRWFVGGLACGKLRFEISCIERDLSTEVALAEEEEKGFDAVCRDIHHAKMSSCSLDEWLEHLFVLYPRLMHSTILSLMRYQTYQNNDAEKRGRFL